MAAEVSRGAVGIHKSSVMASQFAPVDMITAECESRPTAKGTRKMRAEGRTDFFSPLALLPLSSSCILLSPPLSLRSSPILSDLLSRLSSSPPLLLSSLRSSRGNGGRSRVAMRSSVQLIAAAAQQRAMGRPRVTTATGSSSWNVPKWQRYVRGRGVGRVPGGCIHGSVGGSILATTWRRDAAAQRGDECGAAAATVQRCSGAAGRQR